MPESSSLTDGCLIENPGHSPDKFVVKGAVAHFDARLLTLSNHVSRSPLDLFIKPVIEACDRNRSNRLPFQMVWVFWLGLWQSLPKGEKIRFDFALTD